MLPSVTFPWLTWLFREGLVSWMKSVQIKDAQIKILLIKEVFQTHRIEGKGGINLAKDKKKQVSVQATKKQVR